jgi:hypothetical protein
MEYLEQKEDERRLKKEAEPSEEMKEEPNEDEELKGEQIEEEDFGKIPKRSSSVQIKSSKLI